MDSNPSSDVKTNNSSSLCVAITVLKKQVVGITSFYEN